jgi:hypothetical protein
MESKNLYYSRTLVKRIVMAFLFRLHADLHIIINLRARGVF